MKNFDNLLGNMTSSNTCEFSEIPFLNQITLDAKDDIIQARLSILKSAKKHLYEDKTYQIEDFIDHGFIPFLIECLKMPNSALQGYAAWMLTTIARDVPEYCPTIIYYGSVPLLIKLFVSANTIIRSHCFCLLKELLYCQPIIFDQCMELQLHDKLEPFIQPNTSLIEWSWVSYIIGVCKPNQKLLNFVKQFLFSLGNYNDEESLALIVTSLYNLCAEEKEICQAVIYSGILPKLIPLLNKTSTKINKCCVISIFMQIARHREFNDVIIEYGILKAIEKLLLCPKMSADVGIMNAIENFIFDLVENSEFIDAIIEANLIYFIIDRSEWSPYKKLSTQTLLKLMEKCNEKQALKILKMNAIPILSSHFDKINDEEKLVPKILETFFNVLQKIKDAKHIYDEMEEYGVVEKIRILQSHKENDIAEMAAKLIEIYFPSKVAPVNNYSMKVKDNFEIV